MLPPLRTPAYGGEWNLDCGNQQQVAEDIALMRETGVNLVTVGRSSWRRSESYSGRYDFRWLEVILDLLCEADIRVVLATGTDDPPTWMSQKYPETLLVAGEGTAIGRNAGQRYCPTSSVLRQAAAEFTEQVVTRFAQHPAIAMWQANNTYGGRMDECFCGSCTQEFSHWLQEHYTTLDALNEAWGTAFSGQTNDDFSQVMLPRAKSDSINPTQLLDWCRFRDDSAMSLYDTEKRIIRCHSDKPVTTHFSGMPQHLNYQHWAEHADILIEDHYPDPADPAAGHDVAWMGDLMRGLAEGKPWLITERSSQPLQPGQRRVMKRPGQFLLWSLSHIGHGAAGAIQADSHQVHHGAGIFGQGIIAHSGTRSRTWNEMVRAGTVTQRLAPVMRESVKAQAAVLIDWESMWARNCVEDSTRAEYFMRAKAWHRTLWEAGYQIDVVSPKRLHECAAHADNSYSLIIAPEVFVDRPELAADLSALVEAGAQVVVEGPSAVVDSRLHVVRGGYLGSLRELCGVSVSDHVRLNGPVAHSMGRDAQVNRITSAVVTPSAEQYCGLEPIAPSLQRACDRIGTPTPELRCDMWAEELSPWNPQAGGDNEASLEPMLAWERAGVEIIATFNGTGGGRDLAGMAAVTRRGVGAGNAWYVGCDVDAVTRHALLTVWAAHARLRPVIPNCPAGIEALRRGKYLFILNHSDASVQLSGIVGKELVDGGECTGHVMVAPRSAIVVEQGLPEGSHE